MTMPVPLTKSLPFFSQGHRLDADLHLPVSTGGQLPPVIVVASGYQGLKVIHPERFARALVPLGFAVLAFDYRGFGLSEGERGRLVPQEWAEDVRAAVDRLSVCPDVDSSRIGLLGWGLGGGVVVSEAADDPRVGAVTAINAISNGWRATRRMHDDASWADLLRRIASDRGPRSTAGRSEVTSPWDIVRLDLDRNTDSYVGQELYKAPGFGAGVTLESADMLLRFRPEDAVHRLAGRPLLVVHGAENRLHWPEEAQALHDRAAEPKRLVMLDGAGHTEWMHDENPIFGQVTDLLADFFTDALKPAINPAVAVAS